MECSLDDIWDLKVLWNTTIPDVPDCLKTVILIPLPCIFFGLFAFHEVWKTFRQSSKSPHPWTLLFVVKVVLCVILVILSAFELIILLQRKSSSHSSFETWIFSSCCKLITYIGAVCVLFLHKYKGSRSSNMFCIFWFLQSFCGVLMHRSTFLKAYYLGLPPIAIEQFVIEMIYYPVIYSQLILSLFSVKSQSEAKSSMEEETFFLFITYSWLDKLVYKSTKTLLAFSDLTPLPSFLQTTYLWWKLRSKWSDLNIAAEDSPHKLNENVEMKMSNLNSLTLTLIKAFSRWTAYNVIFHILEALFSFLPPIIFDLLLVSLTNEYYTWRKYFFCGALVSSIIAGRFISNLYFLYSGLCALQIKSALMVAIYRKSLKLSSSARRDLSCGELMNFMAVDVEKVHKFAIFAALIFGTPIKILLSIAFLWHYLGPSCMAGIAVIGATMPISFFVGKMLSSIQGKQMTKKDFRLKYISDTVCGIKVLKLFAWEIPFLHKINLIREQEVMLIRKQLLYFAIASLIWGCTPFLIASASFVTYVLVDENNILTPSKLFVSLNILNALKSALFMMSSIISQLAQVSISLKRLSSFFSSGERDIFAVGHTPEKGQAVSFCRAVLSWDEKDKPGLVDISLHIPEGSLVAVVGTVGSGKSSLLSAILGEMIKISGSVDFKGSVAYVPQQAWIFNQTLQQNVLFAKGLDTESYKNVIQACCLESDISQLPGGDQTEIGEKGVNLSGGQKQRLSLARAVYQDADIYLLDDPLSAVDAHVGKHIFDKVIGNEGLLKNKTRILVTHNVSVLPFVDIIFTMRSGKIEESGVFQELLSQGGPFSEFVNTHGKEIQDRFEETLETKSNEDGTQVEVNEEKRNSGAKAESPESLQTVEFKKLIEEEKVEVGKVKWGMYYSYLKHTGPHILLPAILGYFLYQFFEIWTNISLSQWNTETPLTGDSGTSMKYHQIGSVLGLGLFQAIFVVCGNSLLAVAAARASKTYHSEMMHSLLRSPMAFYDTTPQGRIINRCSKDIDTIDCDIPYSLDAFLALFFQTIGTFIVIGMSTPLFFLILIPLVVLYYILQRLFLIISRQLKRLESISRSPVYSYFQESIQGISSIHSYRVEEKFVNAFCKKLDTSISCSYHWFISTRWLGFRLDALSVSIIFTASFLAIQNSSLNNVATVGLSLVYALAITNSIMYLVRSSAELENNAISIERIDEYSNLEPEADWDNSNCKPSNTWPENGCITFKSYSTRYRKDLNLVLNELNLDMSPEEKIGVVGRTGAGKSSLTLALFRIIEPVSGSIIIDNIDISQLGLHVLRSKLTIIPQDPVLFTGTLRANLDPNSEYLDDALWDSLERAHLKDFFVSASNGLDFEISEGGENLSVGQRQLICLARTLLKKSKILVLDEATAAVDMETDKLIQNTIHSEFQSSTVVTIAHRLNTVVDYDTVIVMDSGKVAEKGNPRDLLKDENSLFYSMMKDSSSM